jgi:hypothetical protein
MKRKEILKKRIKLSQEINDLIKMRGIVKDDYKINKLIEQKKKQHEFYNNLLKNI